MHCYIFYFNSDILLHNNDHYVERLLTSLFCAKTIDIQHIYKECGFKHLQQKLRLDLHGNCSKVNGCID